MTIGSVKPFQAEGPAAVVPTRANGETADFAAVARAVAAGNLDAARTALAATPANLAAAGTLAGTLAEGNLAAARLALAQLGTNPFAPGGAVAKEHAGTKAQGPDTRPVPISSPGVNPGNGVPPSYLPPPTSGVPNAGFVPPPPTGNTIAGGTVGNAGGLPAGFMVADVGATIAAAPGPASAGAGIGGPMAQSANGASYSVADILLALATGNAGGIPPDLINRYGPGGALYDPAAIMDAYRNSALGHAQMAQEAWIGKPA